MLREKEQMSKEQMNVEGDTSAGTPRSLRLCGEGNIEIMCYKLSLSMVSAAFFPNNRIIGSRAPKRGSLLYPCFQRW